MKTEIINKPCRVCKQTYTKENDIRIVNASSKVPHFEYCSNCLQVTKNPKKYNSGASA